MLAIQETQSKKQKWVKKWEPHKHCSICGVAIPLGKEEFCSSKCSGEYTQWKEDQEKKNKRNSYMTVILLIGMIAVMVLMTMFGGLG